MSYAISSYGVNLPSGQNLDEEKVAYVCAQLREILAAREGAVEAAVLAASGH